MSPRWGFKTFGFPVCYKHVAPLGLKNSAPIHYTHCAPLEREQSTYRYYRHIRSSGAEHCYKHVAPLGIKTGNSRPLYIWRSVGAKDGR